MIFFSVIIPVYNRAQLVCETVDTVLAQTYSQFEIIIVDDGSSDNTKDVLAAKYNNDPRVSYFYKQNGERGAARNYGISLAKGDYAVFFDSDDWMLPNYLDILNRAIENNPGVFLLAAKYNYNNKGRIELHPTLRTLKAGWYDKSLLLGGNMLACNFCIKINDERRKPFREERDLATMEDWLYLLHNLDNERILIIDETAVTMRQHDDRSMMNNKKVIEARQKATNWALKNLSLSQSQKKTFEAWSHYFCGIHQYLDHKRSPAIIETVKAIKLAGINKKFILLLAKSIVGRKLVLAWK